MCIRDSHYTARYVCTLTAEWEAQRRARLESDLGSEDAITMRLRRAEEDRQRTLRELEEKARTRPDEVGSGEAALRERHANAELAKQQTLQQLHEMNRAKTAAYNQGMSVHTSFPSIYLLTVHINQFKSLSKNRQTAV